MSQPSVKPERGDAQHGGQVRQPVRRAPAALPRIPAEFKDGPRRRRDVVVRDGKDAVREPLGQLRDPARVLAGTDCGFDTSAGMGRVAEDVVWAKLASLVEGARLASQHLFG